MEACYNKKVLILLELAAVVELSVLRTEPADAVKSREVLAS